MAQFVVMFRDPGDPTSLEINTMLDRLKAFGLAPLDGFGGTFLYDGADQEQGLATRALQTLPNASAWTVTPNQRVRPLH